MISLVAKKDCLYYKLFFWPITLIMAGRHYIQKMNSLHEKQSPYYSLAKEREFYRYVSIWSDPNALCASHSCTDRARDIYHKVTQGTNMLHLTMLDKIRSLHLFRKTVP
jgi:hypothetical protein